MLRILAFFTVAATNLGASAFAQRLLVPYRNPPQVLLVDVHAGALVEETRYDLSFLPNPPLTVRDAQRVELSVWVCADTLVHRFDAVTQTYLGAVDTGSTEPSGMAVAGGAVWVAGRDRLVELAFDGAVSNQYPVEDAIDVLARGDELLVANFIGNSIDRYDLAGNLLGRFVVGTPPGLVGPTALAPRPSNGNLLAVHLPSVLEYDATGAVVAEYPFGAFEQGVQEMRDGRFFVTTSAQTFLFDPTGGRAGVPVEPLSGLQSGRVSPFDGGSGAFARTCIGAPNSAGPGALVSALGVPSTAARPDELELSVTGLPPNVPGLFVYGPAVTQLPFGDGFLCVAPAVGARRQPPAEESSVSGRVRRRFDFSTLPPGGSIGPGSVWFFQFLYRDPGGAAGSNGSDAIRVTFR